MRPPETKADHRQFPTSSHLTRAILFVGGLPSLGLLLMACLGIATQLVFAIIMLAQGKPIEPITMSAEDEPLRLVVSVLSFICFFWGMRKRLREPWVYYLGSACLVFWTYMATSHGVGEVVLGELSKEKCRAVSQALGLLLMGLLSFRFLFGRPSRAYYRVAKQPLEPPMPLTAARD